MIFVDEFDVVNGLSGMGRDTVLRLCNLLWNDSEKVRNIIGMCKNHYLWKNHGYFVRNRPTIVPAFLLPSGENKVTITCSPLGELCTFLYSDLHTVFLNTLVSEGIFRWNIKIRYGEIRDCITEFGVGVAPLDHVVKNPGHIFGECSGACSFQFWERCEMEYGAYLWGVNVNEKREERVPDSSVVSLEIDADAQVLNFFVNGKRFPKGISGVPTPLYPGVSAHGQRCSVTLLSFFRLPTRTPTRSPSSAVCVLYKCR